MESYGDLGYHSFGRCGALVVDANLVLSQVHGGGALLLLPHPALFFCQEIPCGWQTFDARRRVTAPPSTVLAQAAFCCAYLIFIGSNVHNVWGGVPEWAAIALTAPGLWLLATIRQLKSLAPFSIVADIGNIGGILMVVYLCTREWGSGAQGTEHRHDGCVDAPAGWTDVDGDDCAAWAAGGYCAKFGGSYVGAGGVPPDQACCACGGGAGANSTVGGAPTVAGGETVIK